MPTQFKELTNPDTPASWANRARKLGVEADPSRVSIADVSGDHSASKLTNEDFLRFKILVEKHSSTDFNVLDYVTEESKEIGKKWARSDGCKIFAMQAKESNASYQSNSHFALVTLYQLLTRSRRMDDLREAPKVFVSPRRPTRAAAASSSSLITQQMQHLNIDGRAVRTPSPSGAGLEATPQPEGLSPMDVLEVTGSTSDEMVVNMALIMLLNALCEPQEVLRNSSYRWLPERDVLKITHPVTKEKLIEARTDGCLRSYRHGFAAAIVEVKPYLRKLKAQAIQRQEGAQMAALIFVLAKQGNSSRGLLRSDNSALKRRLLISQDHGEVYITIAEYRDDYIDYLMRPALPAQTSPAPISSSSRASSSRSSSSASRVSTPTPAPPPPPRGVGSGRGRGRMQTAPAPAPVPVTATSRPPLALSSREFLMMKTYGPWMMRGEQDVKSLCGILGALSHYLSTK